jgi:hypothetical protein
MPEPELAFEGAFADEFEPLGDGKAPWSRYAQQHANGNGNGNGSNGGVHS